MAQKRCFDVPSSKRLLSVSVAPFACNTVEVNFDLGVCYVVWVGVGKKYAPVESRRK